MVLSSHLFVPRGEPRDCRLDARGLPLKGDGPSGWPASLAAGILGSPLSIKSKGKKVPLPTEALYWVEYARLLERKLNALFENTSLMCFECGRWCIHFDHFVAHLALRHVRNVPEED